VVSKMGSSVVPPSRDSLRMTMDEISRWSIVKKFLKKQFWRELWSRFMKKHLMVTLAGVVILLTGMFSFSDAQSNGDYRSVNSGNWNDNTVWQKYNSGVWSASPDYPLSVTGTVTIQSPNIVTIKGSDTVSTLIVNSGAQLQTLVSGDTLWVTGTSAINGYAKDGGGGGIQPIGTGSLSFGNGSTYEMSDPTPGVIPIGTWGTGSTLLLSGITTIPSVSGIVNANQDFYNVTIDLPGLIDQGGRIGWSSNTIHGNLIVKNTNDLTGNNAGTHFISLAPKSNATITIMGDVVLDSVTADLSPGTGSFPISDTLIVYGNITSKGVLYLNGSGVTNRLYAHGNITILNPNVQSFRSHSASLYADTVFFAGTGVQRFIKPAALNLDMLQFRVLSGSTLYLDDTTVIRDAGSLHGTFTLDAGASLKSGHPKGLNGNVQSVGTKFFSKSANYEFNGTTSAQVTGTLLPDTVHNLTFSDPNGDTLSNSVTVSGVCTIGAGSYVIESAGKYVKGMATTTQSVSTGTSVLGGLGASLSVGSDNLANVTLTRTAGSTAAVSVTSNSGIDRKWTISSTNPPSSGRDLTLAWDTTDDNGKNLTSARVWQSTNGALWVPVTGLLDLSGHVVTLKGIKTFGQFTISDAASPLGGIPSYSTDAIAFGNVAVGLTSIDSSVVLTNMGNASMNITGVSSNDVQLTVTPTNFSLSPGISQKLHCAFAPTSVGGKNDLILIAVNGLPALDTLFVTGTGFIDSTLYVQGYDSGIPHTYGLFQNYPNPFNPTTMISYQLPAKSFVTLKIYDELGREVALLVNVEQTAGSYSVRWNAANLSSGMYIYELNAGSYHDVKKMVFMK